MREFFDDKVLLDGEAAGLLYSSVMDLPIIDYHCHLDQRQIAEDARYENIGQMWLAGDHYKWRAMRICGIDERYITGNAGWKEKFLKYASIMPKLMGNPLYYWTHMELKQIFGINRPLNADSAQNIYAEANEKIKGISVRKLLKDFKVEFIATTDYPNEDLGYHKTYDGVSVSPTFRPDKILAFDNGAIRELGISAGIEINSYSELKAALFKRLDFFVGKGCRITDHGFFDFPKTYAEDDTAEKIYKNINFATGEEKDALFGNLLLELMREYKKRGLIAQLRFSVVRNINTAAFNKLGPDSGFDVIAPGCDLCNAAKFLNKLHDGERPPIILYSLNPNYIAPLASISGAFRNVHIGAAWWFNDTLKGIKRNLSVVSEYACLGNNLGMLTDSRLFASYSRFDFFRRILCSFVGKKIDRGEYAMEDAEKLVKDICYYNIKNLLRIGG